jgi:hypothetical protein
MALHRFTQQWIGCGPKMFKLILQVKGFYLWPNNLSAVPIAHRRVAGTMGWGVNQARDDHWFPGSAGILLASYKGSQCFGWVRDWNLTCERVLQIAG